jgi:hypothetical protein
MADSFLTLLDMTKMNGTDQAVGIVEEVRTFAPEADVVGGRPIRGTTYKALVRTALPTGTAGQVFRPANQGTNVVSSRWDQRVNQCFFLDAQMRVDEMVLDASEFGAEWALANEAVGVARQKLINLGNQFYYGHSSTTDFGFNGLNYLYDPAAMEITANATGSLGATTSSAWLIVNEPDCTEFIFGNNMGLQLKQWSPQYVLDSNNRQFRAFLNNLSGYVGLSFNYSKSACRIKNLVAPGVASNTGLTDGLVAQALAKFPVGVRPTHLFCTRQQRLFLQNSRAPVYSSSGGSAITASSQLQFPPIPTESNGIPLYVTDSISDTETASTAGTASF